MSQASYDSSVATRTIMALKAAAFVQRSETSMGSDNSDGNAISQAMPRCNG